MMQHQTGYVPARPKRFDIFLHAIKTSKLIGVLLCDKRIFVLRKIAFVCLITGLLALLLFPDAFNEVVLSTVLPIVGTILGIPLDAGLDWIAFALLIVNLLRLFPAEIVAEHYEQIFYNSR